MLVPSDMCLSTLASIASSTNKSFFNRRDARKVAVHCCHTKFVKLLLLQFPLPLIDSHMLAPAASSSRTCAGLTQFRFRLPPSSGGLFMERYIERIRSPESLLSNFDIEPPQPQRSWAVLLTNRGLRCRLVFHCRRCAVCLLSSTRSALSERVVQWGAAALA